MFFFFFFFLGGGGGGGGGLGAPKVVLWTFLWVGGLRLGSS